MGDRVDIDRVLTPAPNPFADQAALEHSNYCRYEGSRLVRDADGPAPSALTAFVHDSLLALALNPQFTCVGAKSASRVRAYRFGLYAELGSAQCAAGLARDLYTFVQEAPALDGGFTTFLASFEGPVVADEGAFESLLWTTLQHLHDLDARHHAWDPTVSDNAEDPTFSFSFAGMAFFVVGLHAASSRAARRFAWPTLAFNPHAQFVRLKAHGGYSRFQEVIRSAERTLQGDVNPMLADFGDRSEAAQYSGRKVTGSWRCPFRAHGAAAGDPEEKP